MGRLTSTFNHFLFSKIKSIENIISSNNKKLKGAMEEGIAKPVRIKKILR